jgi:hypothetical protein
VRLFDVAESDAVVVCAEEGFACATLVAIASLAGAASVPSELAETQGAMLNTTVLEVALRVARHIGGLAEAVVVWTAISVFATSVVARTLGLGATIATADL